MPKQWIRLFNFEEMLDNAPGFNLPLPPCDKGVYIVSSKLWNKIPSSHCTPLYVGKSENTRNRVGNLNADVFGFFGKRPDDIRKKKRLGRSAGGIHISIIGN